MELNELDELDRSCARYIDYLFKTETLNNKPLILDAHKNSGEYTIERHRIILVDWLVDVVVRFELLPETLYLSVVLTDKYLDANVVRTNKVQLVGIACLYISAKYVEDLEPRVKDFSWVTARAYREKEIVNFERELLKFFDYNFLRPTAYNFLGYFLTFIGEVSRDTICNLSKYICELSLLEHSMLQYYPSQIAASSIYLARSIHGLSSWNETLEFHTHYTDQAIISCARDLNEIVKKQKLSKYRALYKKFLPLVGEVSGCEL